MRFFGVSRPTTDLPRRMSAEQPKRPSRHDRSRRPVSGRVGPVARRTIPPFAAAGMGRTASGRTGDCTLAKERPGCLSLWNTQQWQSWLAERRRTACSKIRGGRLERRTESVQLFGRLLSTRHRTAPIAGRGRVRSPTAFGVSWRRAGRRSAGRRRRGVRRSVAARRAGANTSASTCRSFRQLFDELTE